MKHITHIIVLLACMYTAQAQVLSGLQNPASKLSAFNANCGCVTATNPSVFAVGDRVLIIQMQGASLSFDNNENFGYPQTPASSGRFEFNTIAAIDGSTISLVYTLRNSYDFQNGAVQIVKVLSGADLNVAQLNCARWDGNSGGVIVVEASNTINLLGPIDASSCGFRGAQSVLGSYNCGVHDLYLPATSADGAVKGEGISLNMLGLRARGAWANGGGGGNNHNAGGGGGSMASFGGFGGYAWGNCATRNDAATRGIGGFALNLSSLDLRAYMGGGGGAGHRNDNNPSSGAPGAGIVILVATTINANGQSILCRGGDAQRCEMDGAGGGGAGGSVFLLSENIPSNVIVDVSGGTGGDARYPHGPGGGGSAGAVYVKQNMLPSTVQVRAIGGHSGMNYELGAAAAGFVSSSYGASNGEDGLVFSSAQLQNPTTIQSRPSVELGPTRSLCSSTTEQLHALVQGGQAPYSYTWTPQGVVSNSSVESPMFLGAESVTVMCTVRDARGCTASDSVRINVAAAMNIVVADTLTMCRGNAVTLSAQVFGGSGDAVAVWSPSTNLSSVNGMQVVATPTRSTTYYVSVQDRSGCTTTDSVRVNVLDQQNIQVSGERTVCAGSEHVYTTGLPAQVRLLWTVSGATSVNIDHNTNSARIVWGYGSSARLCVSGDAMSQCVGSQDLAITIIELPQPVLSATSATICEGDSLVLDAGEFNRYAWSNGATSRRLVVHNSGDYSVNVWNAAGCEAASTTTKVNVVARPVAVISQHAISTNPCVADEIELESSVAQSYLWSTGERTRSIRVKQQGEYWVEVANQNGCRARSAAVAVSLGAERRPELQGSNDVCAHAYETYRAAGLSDSYFSWNVDGADDVTYMGSRNDSVLVQWNARSEKGSVVVRENTSAGCTLKQTLAVHVNVVAKPVISADKTEILEGDVATLSAPAGYAAYRWSNGSTTKSVAVRTDMRISVEVTNDRGCVEHSDTVHVTVHPLDEARVLASRLRDCEGHVISLRASAQFGTISWNTGEQGSQINVRASGDYYYTVNNASLSRRSDTVHVEFVHIDKPTIQRLAGTLSSSPAAHYQWFQNGVVINGATDQSYVPTSDASYSVVCSNDFGCTSSSDPVSFQSVVRLAISAPSLKAAAGQNAHMLIHVQFRDAAPMRMPMRVEFAIRASARMVHVLDANVEQQIVGDELVLHFAMTARENTVVDVPCELMIGDTNVSALHVELISTADSSDCILHDGSVEVLGQCGRSTSPNVQAGMSMSITNVYPNPATEGMTLNYNLCESGLTSLQIVDMQGRTVMSLFSQSMERGSHEMQISVAEIPSGSYTLVLQSPSRRCDTRISVAH